MNNYVYFDFILTIIYSHCTYFSFYFILMVLILGHRLDAQTTPTSLPRSTFSYESRFKICVK